MKNQPSTLLAGHSEKFKEMATSGDRYGLLENAAGHGHRTGDCGDSIDMYLTVRGNRIGMITFIVDGCTNTIACGNTVSHLMEGKALNDAWLLTPENVANYLESLPEDHFHCAELAVGAFYQALADYNKKKQGS